MWVAISSTTEGHPSIYDPEVPLWHKDSVVASMGCQLCGISRAPFGCRELICVGQTYPSRCHKHQVSTEELALS